MAISPQLFVGTCVQIGQFPQPNKDIDCVKGATVMVYVWRFWYNTASFIGFDRLQAYTTIFLCCLDNVSVKPRNHWQVDG